MLFSKALRVPVALEDDVFARCVEADRRMVFMIRAGQVGFPLATEDERLLGPREYPAAAHDVVLVSRVSDSLAFAFDTLRTADRQLVTTHFCVEAAIHNRVQFQARCMHGRQCITHAEMSSLVQGEARPVTQQFLHQRNAEDVVNPNEWQIFASVIQRHLDEWGKRVGLHLEHVALSKCHPVEEPMKIKNELARLQTLCDVEAQEGLDRLLQQHQLNVDERTRELLQNQQNTQEIVNRLLEHANRQRCQQCHRPMPPDETFTCRDCHRELCRAHETRESICDMCRAERDAKKTEQPAMKCEISGHVVTKAPGQYFICPQCHLDRCNHCFDPKTQSCVKCAAEAAAHSVSVPTAQKVQRSLHELRQLPQPVDLRFWCNAGSRAVRGVGVAPRCDVRSFHIGQQLQFRLRPDRDGHVRMLVVSSDASSRPLFPNEHCADYFVLGGEDLLFPDQMADFQYYADEPPGLDTLVAVLAPDRFRLFDDDELRPEDRAPGPSNTRTKEPRETLAVLAQIIERVKRREWTCAQCQILVQGSRP